MIAALVVGFMAWVGSSFEECAKCSPTALCAVHLAVQSAAIKEVKPRLKEKDALERTSALKKLGQLNAEHPTLPASEIADLAAAALNDDSYPVRVEAAKQLAAGMHPEVAVRALVAALDQLKTDLSKLPEGRYDDPPEARKDPKVIEQRKLRDQMTRFAETLIDGLGKLPDDRSVDALAEFLPPLTRRNNGGLISPTAEALLKFDARKGVEAVIVKIKLSPAAGGKYGGPDSTGKALHDLLVGAVAAKKLDGAPEWSEKEPPDWEKWFEKNHKHFAAKLGKFDLEKLRAAKS